jgi:hypothetical protein
MKNHVSNCCGSYGRGEYAQAFMFLEIARERWEEKKFDQQFLEVVGEAVSEFCHRSRYKNR